MENNGENTDKMSVFIKTRTKNGAPCDEETTGYMVCTNF